MPKIKTGRILEWLLVVILVPLSFAFGLILDFWQVFIIRVRRPDFAWVIFKDNEDKLMGVLQSYFPMGVATPKDVLLFVQRRKVVSTTYINENRITIHAPAWIDSPWRRWIFVGATWIITFEFNKTLVHISDIPSKNFKVASALLASDELPDIFLQSTLTNIQLIYSLSAL